MSDFRYHAETTSVILAARMYKPREALQQLVDNSLDAGARTVDVEIVKNALGGAERLIITDDGSGISPERYREAFLLIGHHVVDPDAQADEISGSEGIGRFAVFALGREARWTTRARSVTGSLVELSWVMELERSNETTRETERVVRRGPTFTKIEIEVPSDAADLQTFLVGEGYVRRALFNLFASRLLRPGAPEIRVNGNAISAAELVDEHFDEMIGGSDGIPSATLTHFLMQGVVELDHAAALVFTSRGHTIKSEPVGTSLPYRKYLGIIDSPELLDLSNASKTDLLERAEVAALTAEAMDAATRFISERLESDTVEFIKQARKESFYPYKRATTRRERVEQSVYDQTLVLLEHHARISKANQSHQRLMFAMVHRLVRGEDDLAEVLKGVLGLQGEEVERFAELLRYTEMSSILAVAGAVVDRLQFLDSLQDIVIGAPELRLKERKQLQPILEKHTWLFGDQYVLVAADQSVRTILRKLHDQARGADEEIDSDIPLSAELRGVPDFLLTQQRLVQESDDDYYQEHLVVEIKRPGVSITSRHVDQLHRYFDALVGNDLFSDRRRHRFKLVVVSTKISDALKRREFSVDRPFGLIQRPDEYSEVWALTWGHFLDSRRKELKYLEGLASLAAEGADGTLAFLMRTLPDLFEEPTASASTQ